MSVSFLLGAGIDNLELEYAQDLTLIWQKAFGKH